MEAVAGAAEVVEGTEVAQAAETAETGGTAAAAAAAEVAAAAAAAAAAEVAAPDGMPRQRSSSLRCDMGLLLLHLQSCTLLQG